MQIVNKKIIGTEGNVKTVTEEVTNIENTGFKIYDTNEGVIVLKAMLKDGEMLVNLKKNEANKLKKFLTRNTFEDGSDDWYN